MIATELYHHGVKGMKWGHRKARPMRTSNKNYSDKQRKRDRAIYGKGAESRINKRLNKGHGLQGARHYEVERKNTKQKLAKIGKTAVGLGKAYIRDQIFFGGRGTRAVGKATKAIGRAAVTAYVKARGGWDIRWYD